MKYTKSQIQQLKRLFRPLYLIVAIIFILAIGLAFVVGVNAGDNGFSFASSSGLNSNLPANLNFSSVNQEYHALIDNYDGTLTTTQILNAIKIGLANAPGDPYTEYFTASQYQSFNNELNNSFSGIGAELTANNSKQVEIMAPIADNPAAKAGLQAGDIIAAVNSISTANQSPEQVANEIRGPAGSKVTLTIIRGQSEFNVTITRATVVIPSVSYKIIDGDLGYISIITFANDTASLIQKAAQFMVSSHVKGIILDLRNNPGGLVTAAVAVSSLWLKPGQEIMQEKRNNTVLQTYNATGGDILHGIPTVVLVNGGSASASEITAGALHDQGDAYLIGTKTFGKGVVQQLINLSDGGVLKVTIASWYRPDGQDIEHIGITPDKIVNLAQNSTTDTQLQAAESYLAGR